MIPRVEDLASAALEYRYGELFNPPALTNFLGSVQAGIDVTGIRSLNFPPFGTSDAFPPLSWADSQTGSLFFNDRFFTALGVPLVYRWRPDRIEREADVDDWQLRSTTVLAVGRRACLVRLEVRNLRSTPRTLRLRFGVKATVTSNQSRWDAAIAPAEGDNRCSLDLQHGAVLFEARHSAAVCLQGTLPRADDVTPSALGFRREVGAGATWRTYFVALVESTAAAAAATWEVVTRDPEAVFHAATDDWNAELEAAFTPGNDRFSGFLPTLETSSETLRRLYHQGLLGLLYFKRELPHAPIGRVYTTLMPRYWPTLTWLWDYHLGSIGHALLDPLVMRRTLEHWMTWDIHEIMATDWLTGRGVGTWYAINDHAMCSMVHDLVRWSGDRAWLDHGVAAPDGTPRTVMDAVGEYLQAVRARRDPSGLADFGALGNLLECVRTYTHGVAGLQAAHVADLRHGAALLTALGRHAEAASLRAEVPRCLKAMQALYVPGRGYWNARDADGSLHPVRHCLDAALLFTSVAEDLSPDQRDAMARFFVDELRTPTWMHALAPSDPEAVYDSRPDHQWAGAFGAWPAEMATGLCRIGRPDLLVDWLPGVARTAAQGPVAQAYFAETVVPPVHGAARKAPSDFPFLTDWACAAGAAWVRFLIEGIFGVRAPVDGALTARPLVTAFDREARLSQLAFQGQRYTVDRHGVRLQRE